MNGEREMKPLVLRCGTALETPTLLLAAAFALFVGCSSGIGPETPAAPKTTAVYVSGYYNDGLKNISCYWKGTTRVDLPVDPAMGSSGGYALAIAVSEGVVYSAGYQAEGGEDQSACYWMGTTRIDVGGSRANAIRVANGTVYTAVDGYWSTYYGAKYATGTTLTALPGLDPPPGSTSPYAGDFYAFGIDVAGGTVYTAGRSDTATGGSVACYWIGTTRMDLTEGDIAYAIRASGGHVYAAGSYYESSASQLSCYWTDGVKTDLPPGSSTTSNYAYAQAIEVVDSIVYTAGSYSNGSRNVPCYWTDTTRTDLPDGGYIGHAQGIAVLDGVVYAAGSCSDERKDVPCYWKGTERIDLPGDGIHNAYATGIVVVNE